jgi:hypothetical protein
MMTIQQLFERAEENLRRAEAPETHNATRESYARIGNGYARLAEVRMKAMKDGFQSS